MNEEYLQKVFAQTGLEQKYYESFKKDMSSNQEYNQKVFKSIGLEEKYYDAFKKDTGLIQEESVGQPKVSTVNETSKKKEESVFTSTSQELDSEVQDTDGISDSSDSKIGTIQLDLGDEYDDSELTDIIQSINQTNLSDERISELEAEINESYEVSQGFMAKATNMLGKITGYMSGEAFITNNNENIRGDLSNEIEQAKQQLSKEGLDVSGNEHQNKVLERAKEIKLVELVTKERDARVRNYLSNLPEEKKEKALGYAKNKMISLNSDLTNGLFLKETYEKSLKETNKEIKTIESDINLLADRRKQIIDQVNKGVDKETRQQLQVQFDDVNNKIQELNQSYTSKVTQFNDNLKEFETIREENLKNVDNHAEFSEQVDYLKRSYGFLENVGDKWANAWFSISSNFYDAAAYTQELLNNEENYRKLKEESEALKKTVARSSEFMEKPFSIKDVYSVTDLLKYSGNTVVEQSPYLMMGATSYAAPFLFAVNAAGAKAGQIDNMKFKQISPMEKATSVVFAGLTEGVLSSFGTIKNIRKAKDAFKSIGRAERKNGYRKILSDIGEGARNEVIEELSVEFLDAGNNYFMLDDDAAFERFNESASDVVFSSALFGGLTRVSPHVVGITANMYSSAKQKIEINKFQKKTEKLFKIINNPDIPKEDVAQAQKELGKTLEESQEYMQENLSKMRFLSKSNRKRIGEIYYQVNQLKQKAEKVKADSKISKEDKETLLAGYRNKSKKILEEKENILSKIEVNETEQSTETDTELKKIEEDRSKEIEAVELAIIESNETGNMPMVDGVVVSIETINEINEKYDAEVKRVKEKTTEGKPQVTAQTKELSEKRKAVVQALRDVEDGTDKDKVKEANALLDGTPKKLRDAAENQKLREDIEAKVAEELDNDKSDEEILSMFEGKDREIAQDVLVRAEPQNEASRYSKFQNVMNKAKKDREKLSSSRFTLKNIVKGFKEKFLDRTSFAKTVFKKAKLKVKNTSLVDYMIADNGSSGRAAEIFKNIYRKIYYKLNNDEVEILDWIIQAKRLISLESQRKTQGKSDVINPGNLTKDDARAALDNLKKELGDKKFNKLNDRAEEFFSYYQDMLKEMYEEGFIDKDMYDSFKGYDYVQRKFLQHIENLDGEFDYSKASDNSGLAESPIKTINQGSSESLITDSMLLISMYINARSKSISANRVNRATFTSLLDAKERQKSLQEKKGSESITRRELRELEALDKLFEQVSIEKQVPDGFRKVYYYEDGVRKSFSMNPDFYDSYAGQLNGIISTPNMREAIALISGKAILQSFATGNNPTFFITNTPRDFSFISVFSSQYSNFLLKSLGQIAKDLVGGIKEIRKGTEQSYIYKNAVEYGLMMNFLHTQGRVKRNTFVESLNKKVLDNFFKFATFGLADSKRAKDFVFKNKIFDFIGDLQEYGEIGFRLGVFTRTLNNEIKKLKKENPKKYKDINEIKDLEKLDKGLRESMFTKAVAEARAKSAPDFNQSGYILKDIDAAVSYLNAGTQSIRVAAEQAKERPLATSFRLIQAAAIFSGLRIGLNVFLLGALDDDDLPEEYKGLTGVERYLKARQKQSKYQNSNYMHFYYNISKEGEFESFRLAKSHEITPLLSLTENIIANKMAEMYEIEGYQDKTLEELKFTMETNVLPFDLTLTGNLTRVPAINSIMSYSLGYDFYRDQPLSYMQGYVPKEAEGFESDYVEGFYKEIGWQTTESPARIKAAVEAIVTSPRSNPYISLTYGTADALMGGEEGREKKEMADNIKKMFTGRVFSKTSKYSSSVNLTSDQKQELAKMAQQKAIKDFNYNKLIDEFAKNDAMPKDIVDEIILQAGDNAEETKKMISKLEKQLEKKQYPFVVYKLKNMNANERAFMLYNIFGGDFKDKSNKEILNQLMRAKVLNKQTISKYNELIQGFKTGDFNYNYEYARDFLNR